MNDSHTQRPLKMPFLEKEKCGNKMAKTEE